MNIESADMRALADFPEIQSYIEQRWQAEEEQHLARMRECVRRVSRKNPLNLEQLRELWENCQRSDFPGNHDFLDFIYKLKALHDRLNRKHNFNDLIRPIDELLNCPGPSWTLELCRQFARENPQFISAVCQELLTDPPLIRHFLKLYESSDDDQLIVEREQLRKFPWLFKNLKEEIPDLDSSVAPQRSKVFHDLRDIEFDPSNEI